MAATESIRIDKSVVDKVRDYKKVTGVGIGRFFESAVLEKLASCKSKKPKAGSV